MPTSKNQTTESVMRFVWRFMLSFLIVGLLAACCRSKPQPFNILLTAAPTPIPCIDTLGAARYPDALKAVPLDYAIGGFAQTFGDFFPVAKQELDRGRKFIRVNLLWSDTHSYGDKDLPAIRKEAKRYNILCTDFSDAVIELAPFTEHNISRPAKYLKAVRMNAPNCGVVNSVWRGSLTKNPLYKNEVHGSHSAPTISNVRYNFSDDGTNSVDTSFPDTLQKHRNADITCAWNPRLNGKWSMKDNTPRNLRTAWPDREFIRSLVYLFSEKGQTDVPPGWTVKSHAERHSAADLKGDKLLIIAPLQVPYLTLRQQGTVVATLPYYGPFDGGGHRYYASQMGFHYGPDIRVWAGNQRYAIINAGFRDGTFR